MIVGGLLAMITGAILMSGGWFGWDAVLTKALHLIAMPAAVVATCVSVLRFSFRFAMATPKRG
jgi:hypothetical protein